MQRHGRVFPGELRRDPAELYLQLFFDVTAKKERYCCSTRTLEHFGQRTFFLSCSLTVITSVNFLRHLLQA
jgi:hypothetical protein